MIAQREDAKVLVGREKKHKEPVSVVSLFRLMTNRLARDVGYVTVTKDIVVENQYPDSLFSAWVLIIVYVYGICCGLSASSESLVMIPCF
jgi:hypothetical protein